MKTIFEKIKIFLEEKQIPFSHLEHTETPTSIDSAKARGEDLKIGAKALLLKTDDQFAMFVISAANKMNSKKIKDHVGASKIRFATLEELQQITTLVPGSVPPFGNPIFDLPLYIDISIAENEDIAFNAGSLTDSIKIKSADYLKIANGELFDFSD